MLWSATKAHSGDEPTVLANRHAVMPAVDMLTVLDVLADIAFHVREVSECARGCECELIDRRVICHPKTSPRGMRPPAMWL
jgi:hypothetical protein